MESAASNYRPVATLDDDSCLYQGCLDSTALNYDATASLPGACLGAVSGCLDPAALNFYPDANVDSGSCLYSIGSASSCIACASPARCGSACS